MAVTQEQINAATDSLTLHKLQTQIQFDQAEAYKAELQNSAAAREEAKRHNAALEAIFARQAGAAEAMLAAFKQQATAFDASERGAVTRKVFETLLAQAVKPSSATTLEGRIADARGDAEWLRVEVEQVMAVYDGLRVPPGA